MLGRTDSRSQNLPMYIAPHNSPRGSWNTRGEFRNATWTHPPARIRRHVSGITPYKPTILGIQSAVREPVPGTRGMTRGVRYLIPGSSPSENGFRARFKMHRLCHTCQRTPIQISPIFCNRASQHLDFIIYQLYRILLIIYYAYLII